MIKIIPNWHPAFVHFPIAFTTAALVFIAIDILFKNQAAAAQRLMMGRWMLWGAAIFACIAAVFGWFAYNSVKHDEAGHLAMTIHRNWALIAVGALILLTVIDVRLRRTASNPSYGFLILLVMAWLLVLNAAWHGGEVVFRHGLGVMSLPQADEPGHTHEHGAGHEHGEMPVGSEVIPHVDDHPHSQDVTANGEPSQNAKPDGNVPAVNETGAAHKPVAHTHLPGTPPHND